MPTSDPAHARLTVRTTPAPTVVANRTIAFEAIAACALVTVVALVLSPYDAGLSRSGPHLVWMAVLLLAARYGAQGLCLSLPLAAGVVAGTAHLLGQMRALEHRLESSADLVALVGVVLVAWVASTQEARREKLAHALAALKRRCASDHKVAREMRDTLLALRARVDRMNLSLTFMRNVAQRLEGRDPEEAVSAALALAMTCLEARGGVVKLGGPVPDGAGGLAPTLLSWTGPWNANGAAPTLDGDHVVAAALQSARPVNALDVADAGPGDADMAAPLLDGAGQPFGVLAIRGLPYRSGGAMALRDLAVIGEWLGKALSDLKPLRAAREATLAERPRASFVDVVSSTASEVQG